jgi:DNA-directed RNA polymerase specialized sigma24 family protein
MTPPEAPSAEQTTFATSQLAGFVDFFEKTVDTVYAYILHGTRVPDAAAELTLNVYFSLLQRQRFLWWRTNTSLAMILAIADREMAGLPAWQEQATGYGYIEELLHCVQGTAERQRMRHLLQGLRKLPVREQRLAILTFFLHWSAEKIAMVFGKKTPQMEKEVEQLAALLCEQLKVEERKDRGGMPVPEEVCGVLSVIRCPELPTERKNAFRMALLERCQTMPMSSMRFAIPLGAAVFLLGIFISTFLFPRLSARGTFERIAAVEVLLLSQEIEARNTFVAAEQDLRGIAASSAQGDVLRMSLRLAPLAAAEQLQEEVALGEILKKLGESDLLQNPKLVTYRR